MSLTVAWVAIVVLWSAACASAAVNSLNLTVTPAAAGVVYNAGVSFNLAATWASGTAPFAASFKTRGITVGTVNTSQQTATLAVSGATLQEGAHTFTVDVIETSVPGATATSATANTPVNIDKSAPTVTVTVTEGAVVSPNAGFNLVRFTVSSNERMPVAPTVTVEPNVGLVPQVVGPPVYPTNTVQYTLRVASGTAGGVYTIRAQAYDDTLPENSRNFGVGQDAFRVISQVEGTPTITGTTPRSPCRVTTVQVTGSVPAETSAQKVEILVDGVLNASTNVAANQNTFSVAVTGLTEGSHTLTGRRIDSLGNVSPGGGPYTLVIDTTPPTTGVVDQPKTPTNQIKIKVTGTGVRDVANSTPVKVTVFVGGNPVGSTTAKTDGSFEFNNVPLEDGQNFIQVRSADTTWDLAGDAGNVGSMSQAVRVDVDRVKPSIVGGIVVISGGPSGSPSPPPAPTTAAPADGADAPGSPDAPVALLEGGQGEGAGAGASAGHAALGGVTLGAEPPVAAAPGSGAPSPGRFLPPVGGSADGRVVLPRAVYGGEGVTRVFLEVGPAEGVAVANLAVSARLGVPMRPTADGAAWEAHLPPAAHGDWGYRFRFEAADGQVTWWPLTGNLVARATRSDTLIVAPVVSAGDRPGAGGADWWSTEALQMPPAGRLLRYRRVLVAPEVRDAVLASLAPWRNAGAPVVLPLGGRVPPPALLARRDLRSWLAGRLPAGRLDLLLRSITNGEIATEHLPDPERLPADAAGRQVAEAIRFRRLHRDPR